MMIWLAQGNSTGSTDFIRLILPLVAMTLFFFVVWVGMTMLIMQRAAERRRRQRDGLEPLPSFYAQAWLWISQQFESPKKDKPAQGDEFLPDLDQLISDLPDDSAGKAAPPMPDWASQISSDLPNDSVSNVPPNRPVVEEEAAVEVLRVLRDIDGGKLLIDLRGQYFSDIEQLSDPKTRRRFENLVMELLQIVGEEQLRQRFKLPLASPPPPPSPSPPAPTPVLSAGLGIADQIEALLQQRLLANPGLAARQIHIHPDDSGGVKIEVDSRFYETVGDVQDEQVRHFLQATMQAWSDQQ